MNQLIRHIFTSLFIAVLWLAGTAQAQSDTWIIKVHVPFEFVAGDKTFPAGDYSLVEPLPHLLELRDFRGHVIASMFTHAIESSTLSSNAKLKFFFSGGEYVLAEVWLGQESIGHQLVRPKPGVALARQRIVDTPAATGGSRP